MLSKLTEVNRIEERIPKKALEKIKKDALKDSKTDITMSTKEAESFLEKRARRRYIKSL